MKNAATWFRTGLARIGVRAWKRVSPNELFTRFRAVLDSNNRSLEIITDMGDTLGGDYLFDIQYVRRSYENLSAALERSLASFDDLGSYGLLLGLQDTLSLEVFYDSVLGKLREYDEQNSSDLVNSLACFLEANGHWGDAAEKLYVHRHTLRYRMKRVEEITGRDLDLSQDRMEFWLALKARELIDQSKKGKGPREV